MSELFDQAFWDERYRSQSHLWSGEPNRYMVSEASELNPGTALDVGCGEGADAIWLAARGWQVTAVDLSAVALERAAANAAAAGDEVAGRIDWRHVDATGWDPDEHFDLISAQYLHLPTGHRQSLWQQLAAAVSPGGSLLIVGHHPSDLETTIRRPPHPELFFTGDDIVAALQPARWEVVTNAEPQRSATDSDGQQVTIRDTVFRARRTG
jgi:SAM-dependent methyltransferase